MKKYVSLIISALLLISVLSACGEDEAQQLQNPWTDYSSIYEAEAAAGFEFALPEEAGEFKAQSFRVMEGGLLEVKYSDGDFEVILRKAKGEGQDISGVYESFPQEETESGEGWSNTLKYGEGPVLNLISAEGCSYSLWAPGGYPGDSGDDFIRAVLGDKIN